MQKSARKNRWKKSSPAFLWKNNNVRKQCVCDLTVRRISIIFSLHVQKLYLHYKLCGYIELEVGPFPSCHRRLHLVSGAAELPLSLTSTLHVNIQLEA